MDVANTRFEPASTAKLSAADAVDAQNGELLWKMQVDPDPFPVARATGCKTIDLREDRIN